MSYSVNRFVTPLFAPAADLDIGMQVVMYEVGALPGRTERGRGRKLTRWQFIGVILQVIELRIFNIWIRSLSGGYPGLLTGRGNVSG